VSNDPPVTRAKSKEVGKGLELWVTTTGWRVVNVPSDISCRKGAWPRTLFEQKIEATTNEGKDWRWVGGTYGIHCTVDWERKEEKSHRTGIGRRYKYCGQADCGDYISSQGNSKIWSLGRSDCVGKG
jgi:hypothetical protein